MNSLIIINEDFLQMHLGQSTSLFYAVEEIKNGRDVYIFNLDKNSLPKNNSNEISCLFLDKNHENSLKLVEKYEFFNQNIINLIKNQDFDGLLSLKTPEVREIMEKIPTKTIKFRDFDKIIQRLEPMKAPFPPIGDQNIDETLKSLKNLFPNKKIHLPINLNDKIIPLKLNDILDYEIATPTAITSLEDEDLEEKIALLITKYQEIYSSNNKKIVIKPINSAQSLGVFAIEFSKNGENYEKIVEKTANNLKKAQIFHIKDDLDQKTLRKIFQILCFVQNSNLEEKIKNIPQEKIIKNAAKLYNEEILIQPFIEGVKEGDIRANIMKNENDEFYLAGYVYRKSIQEGDNFTTCYSAGKALSLPITYLTKTEQENLRKKTNDILNILNNDLHQQYKNVLELGFDFLIIGNQKDILLGEINHHCPALLPISKNIS